MLCGLLNFFLNLGQKTYTRTDSSSGQKEHRGIIDTVSELALDQSYTNFEDIQCRISDNETDNQEITSENQQEITSGNQNKRINSYLVKMIDGFEFELNCTQKEYNEIKDIVSPRKLVQIIYYWPDELEYPYATEVHPLIQNDFEIMTWREVLDSHNFEYNTPIKVSKKGPLRLEFLKNPQTYIIA